MAEKKNFSDSKALFIVGTIVHAVAWLAFIAALCFGIMAATTYAESTQEGGADAFGAAFGAVLLFVFFLIAGGVHQVLGFVAIPLLFPYRRAENDRRRIAARILLIGQGASLFADYILLIAILFVFRVFA